MIVSKPNKYPETCPHCHCRVEVGQGILCRAAGSWHVYHQECFAKRITLKKSGGTTK